MALKKTKKREFDGLITPAADVDKQIAACDEEIKRLDTAITTAIKSRDNQKRLRAELEMSKFCPFKIGDKVLYLIPAGRTKKETVCELEWEDGQVYLRPIKEDGTKSTRHFYLYSGEYKNLKAVE